MRAFESARILGVCVAALLCAGGPSARAAEALTANTLRLGEGEPAAQATIDAMAWLAGAWSGSGLGGDNEEIWSAPRDGSMMGMYRLIRDGEPAFYELLTLTEADGSLMLRLKHFHPDLRGWEERDESVAFPLVAIRNGRFYFDGLTFEPRDDGVTIYLAIENSRSGTVREEVLRYRRGARFD